MFQMCRATYKREPHVPVSTKYDFSLNRFEHFLHVFNTIQIAFLETRILSKTVTVEPALRIFCLYEWEQERERERENSVNVYFEKNMPPHLLLCSLVCSFSCFESGAIYKRMEKHWHSYRISTFAFSI